MAIDGVRAQSSTQQVTDDDPAELAAMFERHVRPLLRYCACRVGPDAAEDVVAEVFVVAYAQRKRFDPGRASALTWLYGIATNVARRHQRTELRIYRTYARGAVDDVEEPFADRAASRADAHRRAARAARRIGGFPMIWRRSLSCAFDQSSGTWAAR